VDDIKRRRQELLAQRETQHDIGTDSSARKAQGDDSSDRSDGS
jgi:hypothetical protein